MRTLSPETRKILENDLRMKMCCLSYLGGCARKIEWHHNLIFAGRQSDYPKHILGVCLLHHDMARETRIKEQLDYIMLAALSEQELSDISKAIDYRQRLEFLQKKYNNPQQF